MKIILILAALIAAPILYIRYKVNHFMDHMPPEQRAKWERAISIEQERAKNHRVPLQSPTVYHILRDSLLRWLFKPPRSGRTDTTEETP